MSGKRLNVLIELSGGLFFVGFGFAVVTEAVMQATNVRLADAAGTALVPTILIVLGSHILISIIKDKA